jgi:hypothetical protein
MPDSSQDLSQQSNQFAQNGGWQQFYARHNLVADTITHVLSVD